MVLNRSLSITIMAIASGFDENFFWKAIVLTMTVLRASTILMSFSFRVSMLVAICVSTLATLGSNPVEIPSRALKVFPNHDRGASPVVADEMTFPAATAAVTVAMAGSHANHFCRLWPSPVAVSFVLCLVLTSILWLMFCFCGLKSSTVLLDVSSASCRTSSAIDLACRFLKSSVSSSSSLYVSNLLMSSNLETLGKNFVYTGSVFWTLILRLVTSAASVRVTDMMLIADSLSRLQL
jgi:hypothetical protein